MKSLTQLAADWRAARAAMQKLQADTPRIIGNECVAVVKDNFRLQGYDSGHGITHWPPRSAKTNKAYDRRYGVRGSRYNSKNPLLLQTRNLFNAVRYLTIGTTVEVGVDAALIPYAKGMNYPKAMNEGTSKGIPARKFIPANGEPPNIKMIKLIVKKIYSERDKSMSLFKL